MYSDSDELGDDELEGEIEEEIISTGTGQAILRLGAELVMSDYSEEDLKEEAGNLLVKKEG